MEEIDRGAIRPALSVAALIKGISVLSLAAVWTGGHIGEAYCRREIPAIHRKARIVHLATSPPFGRRRLMDMVNEDKKRFGDRLCGLLKACEVDGKEFAKAIDLTTVQVNNYLKGEQGPTFDGMVVLRGVFGVRSGEIDGSEPWPSNLDTVAVKNRITDLINEIK